MPAGSRRIILIAAFTKRLKTSSVVWPEADSTNTTSCVLKGSQYVGSGNGVGAGPGVTTEEVGVGGSEVEVEAGCKMIEELAVTRVDEGTKSGKVSGEQKATMIES